MAGTSYLPAIVEVAFGAEPLDAGTLTWTDISDYVRRNGIDFSRGWDTEAGEPQAGRLTFTLNNESGDFTPGATGAFGEIRNRLPVRVSAVVGTATGNALTYDEAVGWYDMAGVTYNDAEIGTVVLWTGLVESWRISWENGVRSQVAVTAVDRWAAIRRVKIDEDRFTRAADATSADVAFRLGETSEPLRPWRGGSAWGDGISSIINASLKPPTMASEADPIIPTILHPKFQPVLGKGVMMVGFTSVIDPWSLDTGVSLSVLLRASGMASGDWVLVELAQGLTGLGLGVYDATGDVHVESTRASGGTIATGASAASALISGGGTWFVLTMTAKRTAGTVTVYAYLNGVQVATGSAVLSDFDAGSPTVIEILANAAGTPTYSVGGIAAHRRVLSASEVAFMSRQVTTWAGDTAAQRAATLKEYGPVLVSTTGTFTSTMSNQDLADKSLADALQECSTAERGTIYIDRDGWPVLTSRSWRVDAAVAFTIPATALGREVSWTLDDQNLANSATVERMVGDTSAATVKAKNDASVTTYGEQNRSLQIWVDTDAQLLERANAEANIDAYPLPRSSDLTVDLLTKAATIPAATLLAADIGQRVAVSGLPAEAPGETEFYIENIADKITTGAWERTFTVSPRADYWTLQDATYGALDSTFVLAF